eukprot:1196021-Prorocentrum_minimum.AAC.4
MLRQVRRGLGQHRLAQLHEVLLICHAPGGGLSTSVTNMLCSNRYGADSANIDWHSYTRRDSLVFFAGSNDGAYGYGTIQPESQTKNVVAVGATRMPASQLPAFGDIRAQGAPPDRRTLGVQGSGFRGLDVQVVPARPRALGLGFQGLWGEGNYPARARRVVCESTHAEQLGSLGDPAAMVGRLGSRWWPPALEP